MVLGCRPLGKRIAHWFPQRLTGSMDQKQLMGEHLLILRRNNTWLDPHATRNSSPSPPPKLFSLTIWPKGGRTTQKRCLNGKQYAGSCSWCKIVFARNSDNESLTFIFCFCNMYRWWARGCRDIIWSTHRFKMMALR